ncbi:MAG: electron transfer flavoprotein-ubiquinone oxidoreductase, partial [Desulfobacteraceae bacterium]|nr:electron transfer flavoprotein-ubiquinone oxidoreductase [Desulfobacteraceae bacterium]
DRFYYLTSTGKFSVPFVPDYMHNNGCYIISISAFTSWLGEIAEELDINIFPGFAGTRVLYGSDKKTIIGVATGDKGIDKNGTPKSNYEPGIDLTAKVSVFGEGSKGSLTREVGETLGIFSNKMPQVFETAIKEVIEIPKSSPFLSSGNTVLHTFGYPLGLDIKGGGFLYRMKENRISLGLVLGLDYEDPMIEPYEAFLNFKKHPLISDIIKGGKIIQQGAKTLPAGGYYTIPTLSVNGALFVGDSAAMLNAQRLKGIHTAMKSGMLAAQTIVQAFESDNFSNETLKEYPAKVNKSWIHKEHYKARNFSQALSKKGIIKFVHIAAQYISGGRGIKDPLPIQDDSTTLRKINKSIDPPDSHTSVELDGELYVDKLTGVYLSGTQHEEDQPCHLIIHDPELCTSRCYVEYRNPCTRFCPGRVYEIIEKTPKERHLRLNPSNCLHCKTCEIIDPYKNITWTCPEGGGGPRYSLM